MKRRKNKNFSNYIYIRLDENIKNLIKEAAKKDGSNMTIWVRQLIMRTIGSNNDIK